MINLQIETKEGSKGRSFNASLLASVECDPIWSSGAGESRRPIWAMFAGFEAELRAFTNNLQLGNAAKLENKYDRVTMSGHGKHKWEFMRSQRYQTVTQRTSAGVATTIFLPELFRLDPGFVDPDFITFVLLPSKDWILKQKLDSSFVQGLIPGLEVTPEYAHYLCATAHMFCAYLDRRTRCPLVMNPKFFVRLMLRCLDAELASFAVGEGRGRNDFGVARNSSFFTYGTETIGLLPGVCFRAEHSKFEELLMQETTAFFQEV